MITPSTKVIRAWQLNIGDIFIKQSVTHKVVDIIGKHFRCKHITSTAVGKKYSNKGAATISIFSQERVELIIKTV